MEILSFIDKAFISILLQSCAAVVYACGMTIGAIFPGSLFNSHLSPSDKEDQQEITANQTFIMLILSSVALLLIFYFKQYVLLILKCLYIVLSFFAFYTVLWDLVNYVYKSQPTPIICVVLTSINTINWVYTGNSIATNTVALSMAIFAITRIKITRLQIILLFSICFLLHDVYWVFFSHRFFKKSVMVETAKSASNLPILISSATSDSKRMLGLGDIVLPGIILNFFIRYDYCAKTSSFKFGTIGYVVGIILANIVCRIMNSGQPALLYIIPTVLVGSLVPIFVSNKFFDIWTKGTTEFDSITNIQSGQSVTEINPEKSSEFQIDIDIPE